MLPPVPHPQVTRAPPLAPAAGEAAARRELRRQVAGLERRLSDAVLSAFPHALAPAARMTGARGKRGETPRARGRPRGGRGRLWPAPRRHRFERVACAELGEP